MVKKYTLQDQQARPGAYYLQLRWQENGKRRTKTIGRLSDDLPRGIARLDAIVSNCNQEKLELEHIEAIRSLIHD